MQKQPSGTDNLQKNLKESPKAVCILLLPMVIFGLVVGFVAITLTSQIYMAVLYNQAPASLVIGDGQLEQNTTNELVSDWNVVPFISLQVVGGDQNCPEDHPEEAFFYETTGYQQFCTCERGAKQRRFMGRDCDGLKLIYNDCRYQSSVPSTKLSSIDGKKVCGQRGGRNFLEAIRPT